MDNSKPRLYKVGKGALWCLSWGNTHMHSTEYKSLLDRLRYIVEHGKLPPFKANINPENETYG